MRGVLPHLKQAALAPSARPPCHAGVLNVLQSDSVVIRPERPDQPEVAAVLSALDGYLASLYPPHANHILDIAEMVQSGVHFLVARCAGQVVGTGACRLCPPEPATAGLAYGEIKRMYVDPQYRGHGMGGRLLQALEAHLQGSGCAWSLLETGAYQLEAVRLYRRAGYRERGPFGGYPDNGLSLFLAKPLCN